MSAASSSSSSIPGAVAVYCASSLGQEKAFCNAALSIGRALASANRPLVYGGGSKGLMGVVSGAVLEGEGRVVGVVPYAMVAAGGEGEKTGSGVMVNLNEAGREKVETLVVETMHERKVEMARRSEGFIGLPGGLGTFEEVLEVTTWTQLGIHCKPVVLVNVLGFWEPLRALIRSSVSFGFIKPESENIIVFVDGPEDQSLHEEFDWGSATLAALDKWKPKSIVALPFDWTKKESGQRVDNLSMT
ncbi:hypothetical protein H1R20_g5660, partial [Candolleomyces eurysporus]